MTNIEKLFKQYRFIYFGIYMMKILKVSHGNPCHTLIAWGYENALFLLKENNIEMINWRAGCSSTLYHHKVMSGML
jgi:hypothetical protein